MIIEEVLSIPDKHTPERKEAELRCRIYEDAHKYLDSPVEKWPSINMNWDVSKESQIYTLDNRSKYDFKNNYPEGFLLGYVSLFEVDSILHSFSRRDEGELWEVGIASKLAGLIVYLSEGRPISPPLVKPVENDEVILLGGHHRYAIAKVIGVKRLPIYIAHEHKVKIDGLLAVEWVEDL